MVLMKKIILLLIIITANCHAEPPNIADLRLQLSQYHDSGKYMHDIAQTANKLKKYIDYPLYFKMVSDNKSCFSENILSIYVLSKWLTTRNIK